MKPLYTQILSKEERLSCMKVGAALAMKSAGITPSAMHKSAQLTQALSPSGIMQVLAIGSLLAGVPIGTLAHVVGRRISTDEAKAQELKERIKYYRNATRGLESELAPATSKVDSQDTNVT